MLSDNTYSSLYPKYTSFDRYDKNVITVETTETNETIGSTDSAESFGEECYICFIKIKDDTPYASIDNEKDIKCHPECLEQWINKANKCLITDEKIQSYSIYHNNSLIETIKVNSDQHIFDINKEVVIDINIPENNTDELDVVYPPHVSTTSSRTRSRHRDVANDSVQRNNQNNSSECRNCCMFTAVIIIIGGLFYLIRTLF